VELLYEFFIVFGGLMTLYNTWLLTRNNKMLDAIGQMQHVWMFHPEELTGECGEHTTMPATTHYSKKDNFREWDES
jgi:hypothetical protein